MGNWNISIRGIGPHHNGKSYDAERLAAALVDNLKAQGHRIVAAEVTYGGVEVLEDGQYGGREPQARNLLPLVKSILFVLALALGSLFSAPAWASEVVAGEPTAVGSILTWVAFAVLGLVVAGVGAVGLYLRGRSKESKAWAIVNSLWVLMQTAVAHAEKELRPEIAKALADGKLTPEEARTLKAKVLEVFKGMAAGRIDELAKLLKLGETGVGVFLSGLLERAVATMKIGAPASAPAPVKPADGFFGNAPAGNAPAAPTPPIAPPSP